VSPNCGACLDSVPCQVFVSIRVRWRAMKVMLTSFGIGESCAPTLGQSIFHQIPQVSFRRISEAFLPDYELLVLCDQVVMDALSSCSRSRGCKCTRRTTSIARGKLYWNLPAGRQQKALVSRTTLPTLLWLKVCTSACNFAMAPTTRRSRLLKLNRTE